VFVVGSHFQSANQFDVNNGWMPHGPFALPSQLNRDTWNWLTPLMLCITTSADPGYWSGFSMQVRNPDGQTSNSVTVQNLLGAKPALPSSESTDPFDPNACYDAEMTSTEALARFPPAATTVTLGTLSIMQHARACNTATGCAAWGAATEESSVAANLQISGGVHFALGTTDCGTLGNNDYTLVYNSCSTTDAAGSYNIHVANSCLMLWQTTRSIPAGDGSYTQTDYGAVLRF
jgi:hypothetical protein